jgi:hypothetical protein
MITRTALRRLVKSNFKLIIPQTQHVFSQQRQMNSTPDPDIRLIQLEEAKKLPREFEEMSNDVITILAVLGDQEAREERLIREIMRVDSLTWKDAQPRFKEIVSANRQGMWLATLPYKVGFVAAVSAAFISIPMVILDFISSLTNSRFDLIIDD